MTAGKAPASWDQAWACWCVLPQWEPKPSLVRLGISAFMTNYQITIALLCPWVLTALWAASKLRGGQG